MTTVSSRTHATERDRKLIWFVLAPLGNSILDEVNEGTRNTLRPDLSVHRLGRGKILFESGDVLRYVWLPTSGVVSLYSTTRDGGSIGLAAVGSESLLGATLTLAFRTAPCRGFVQVEGTALRVEAAAFSRAVRRHADLREAVLVRWHRLLNQLVQSAACSKFHSVEQRVSRWLLEIADRANEGALAMTHDALADMLGTRRPWVTRVIGGMRARGFIRVGRGELVIADRAALRRIACECYSPIAAR